MGEHMKIKALVGATVLALWGAGAFAGSSTFAGGVASFSNDAFSSGTGFTQSITFTGLSSSVSYDIVGTVSGNLLTFTGVSLNGLVWDISNQTTAKGKHISFAGFEGSGPATLTLTLSGTRDSVSSFYNGSLTVTPVTPVPEPSTYVMLLAGLGAIGAIARRRNNTGSA